MSIYIQRFQLLLQLETQPAVFHKSNESNEAVDDAQTSWQYISCVTSMGIQQHSF